MTELSNPDRESGPFHHPSPPMGAGGQVRPNACDRAVLGGHLVARLVGWHYGIAEAAIFGARRGAGEIARARQIAMYLLHTSLSASYGEVANAFGRDRTTVAHACRLIEDMRDDRKFDALLSRLEDVLSPAAALLALGEDNPA